MKTDLDNLFNSGGTMNKPPENNNNHNNSSNDTNQNNTNTSQNNNINNNMNSNNDLNQNTNIIDNNIQNNQQDNNNNQVPNYSNKIEIVEKPKKNNNQSSSIQEPVKEKKSIGPAIGAIIAILVSVGLIYYVSTYVLSSNNTSEIIDSSRNDTFIMLAKNFIFKGKSNAYNDKSFSCKDDIKTKKYYLKDLEIDADSLSSPYDSKLKIDTKKSFIYIESYINEYDKCNYKASIYMTDGNNTIGTIDEPVFEDDLSTQSINKK